MLGPVCTIPLNASHFPEMRRIIIREDVRLVKGEGAVDKFDRLWNDADGKVPVHPELEKRIADILGAVETGRTSPGIWKDADGVCHQNWVVFACFARWYHATTPANREAAIQALATGNNEPWWNQTTSGASMTDMPYACGGATTDTCCPESVYTDEQYLEEARSEAEDSGASGLFTALVATTAAIGAAIFVPWAIEKTILKEK